MSKLTIKRISEWNNKARAYKLYINNKKIGTITNGKTKDFELEPGKHQLVAKVDWCGSQVFEFEIKENENRIVEVAGFKYGNLILPIFLGTILIYFLSNYIFNIKLKFLLGILPIVFLYPMYYITFKKNNYLRITKLK